MTTSLPEQRTTDEFDLRATTRPDCPGIFLDNARVASLGVAVSRWIAYHGAIVNVGSYACYQPLPGIVAYAAAKGALAQITRTFALEAIEHGIRVNAVGSGDVVTNLLNTFREDGREFLAEHGTNAPIKRAAKPEEIAEVVAFLASEKASFLVGSIVMADGGMSVVVQ